MATLQRYCIFTLYRAEGVSVYSENDPASQVCETTCTSDDPASCINTCHYQRSTTKVVQGNNLLQGVFNVASSSQVANLKLDLEKVTGLMGQSCINDNGNFSCSPLSTGTIDLNFRSDGSNSVVKDGVTVTTNGEYTTRSVGRYSTSGANVTGSLLGATVQATGNISHTQGNSVTLYITKN